MHKNQGSSVIVPNLNELDELPFLKKDIHVLNNFKDKEKYLPTLRSISYQCSTVMSKIFVFALKQERKGKKIVRHLELLTEKQIITVQQLFQLLNENLPQNQFSQQVQKIKQLQHRLYKYVDQQLAELLLEFQDKNYLNFGVYKYGEEFYIKGSFRHFNYSLRFDNEEGIQEKDNFQSHRIVNYLVKQELMKKYHQLEQMSFNMALSEDLPALYNAFYDTAYFMYDEYILQLQVFQNYPLLRIKNYLPLKFTDYKTEQPLKGPIFSNSNQQCMFGHFIGYNANTIKQLEGQLCENCQILIQQFQQNELLMMLRDNVVNPEGNDIFYCPEYNRLKLWRQVKKMIEVQGEGGISQQVEYTKTEIKYLNYYHFRINCKKMTTKYRLYFNPTKSQEAFPLVFNFLNRTMLITDPARGKYCQHYAFTDLRLFYANFNPKTNSYACPIEGCNQNIQENDVLYLKEVQILIDYAKFKCQQWPDLVNCSKIVLENNEQKVYLSYKARQYGTVTTKIEEIKEFYKTMIDPFVPFPDYTLGLKERERKQKMEEYMFGGLKEEAMQAEGEMEEEDEEY